MTGRSSTAHLHGADQLQACCVYCIKQHSCISYTPFLLAKGPEFIAYPFLASTALYRQNWYHAANRSYSESSWLWHSSISAVTIQITIHTLFQKLFVVVYFYFLGILVFICISVCLHVSKYITCVSDAERGQKRASDPSNWLRAAVPPRGCWEQTQVLWKGSKNF